MNLVEFRLSGSHTYILAEIIENKLHPQLQKVVMNNSRNFVKASKGFAAINGKEVKDSDPLTVKSTG